MFRLDTVRFLWLSGPLDEFLNLVVPFRFLFLLFSQKFCENPFGVSSTWAFLSENLVRFSLHLIFLSFCGMFSHSSFDFPCYNFVEMEICDLLSVILFVVKAFFFVFLFWTHSVLGGKWCWGFGPSSDRFLWKDPPQWSFLTRLAFVSVSFFFNHVSCASPWQVYGCTWTNLIGMALLIFDCFFRWLLSRSPLKL